VLKTVIVKTFHEALDVMCATVRYRIGCKGFVTYRICLQVVYKKAGFEGPENESRQRRIDTRLLRYRPIAKQPKNFSSKIAPAANSGSDKFPDFSFDLFYCTNPTGGMGLEPSGASLIEPNCASYREIFSPRARQMRFAWPGLTITLLSSLPCVPLGKM
jgi:hypothetical protein